jgi:serine phosphatase RsbU (regulator of sigma subunit)
LPSVPGVSLAARYEAAGARYDVGGDFYDAFSIPGEGWLAVVGDVCGKGPEAAALTAMCRYTLRAEASHGAGPADLLAALNREILGHEADLAAVGEVQRFATVGCVALRREGEGYRMRTSAAGHPDVIVLRAGGGAELVPRSGPPVGAFPRATYTEEEHVLSSGDAVILYTDGVLDAGAPARPLDVGDLAATLVERAPRGAEAVADTVEDLVHANAPEAPRDDYAILVLAVL